jgi:hypothetical protein
MNKIFNIHFSLDQMETKAQITYTVDAVTNDHKIFLDRNQETKESEKYSNSTLIKIRYRIRFRKHLE